MVYVKETKKGVSPVITTVLLIAIVVALGAIIFVWSRGFIGEKITKFPGEDIERACERVQLDATGYKKPPVTSGTIKQFYITNIGNVPIYKIGLKKIYAGSEDISIIELSIGLGETIIYEEDIDNVEYTETEFGIIPVLLGKKGGKDAEYQCTNNVIEVKKGF